LFSKSINKLLKLIGKSSKILRILNRDLLLRLLNVLRRYIKRGSSIISINKNIRLRDYGFLDLARDRLLLLLNKSGGRISRGRLLERNRDFLGLNKSV
jgi:hypothetical protein